MGIDLNECLAVEQQARACIFLRLHGRWQTEHKNLLKICSVGEGCSVLPFGLLRRHCAVMCLHAHCNAHCNVHLLPDLADECG